MRLGVIARGEDRGLGNQTWEVCRALNPDRVILVDMQELAGRFATHRERFYEWDTNVIAHNALGVEREVGWIAESVDVWYSAETFYRWPFVDFCRKRGVATVCHLNPEFYGHHIDFHEPSPTQWWAPSSWLRDDPRMPSTVFMPMPVPLDRWPEPVPKFTGERPLRVLHVSGHAAMGDRNGTRTLLAALRHVTQPVEITVTTQDNALPSAGRLPRNVKYRLAQGHRDYWRLYEGHDVLVMPRRYGGLCLPAIEAAGAGLALVMSDTSPNRDYPAEFVPGTPGSPLRGKIGEIEAFTTSANWMARVINDLASSPSVVAELQGVARAWAEQRSWVNRVDDWRRQLAEAVDIEHEHHT